MAMPSLQFVTRRIFLPNSSSSYFPQSLSTAATTNLASRYSHRSFSATMSSSSSHAALTSVAPLEAILFDIDGTLCDSDPIHYYAFREMLQEVGFNGGEPITEEYFSKNISGGHNEDLCHFLFPDWDIEKARKFMEDKEALFRKIAAEKLEPVTGLDKLCAWLKDNGVRRAAVTNAPRPNAELLISLLGLGEFFELLIIGAECERAKPFPDPYLRAVKELGISSEHAFIFEDSASGTKAGVAAGMPVVAISTRNAEELLLSAGATIVIENFADPKLWKDLEGMVKKPVTVKATLPPSLSSVAPLEAILFDIDGTLCDSDPFHYYAFREMLQEVGFNGGEPITEEYFSKNISGGHNEDLCHFLFPDWEIEKARKFMEDKEALFRKIASEQLKPVVGLDKLCAWLKHHGVRRAAVTNAPRPNAELMISLLGLGEFFELLIIGAECERAKPFPDPYLRAAKELGISTEHAFIFEDSASGTKAGVAAGMPVVAISTRNAGELLLSAGATMVIENFADPKLWKDLEGMVKKPITVKATL